MLPRRTAAAIAITGASFLLLPHVPGLAAIPGIPARTALAAFLPRLPEIAPLPPPPETPTVGSIAATKSAPNLSVPPHSLDRFFNSLRQGEVTRVLHYGDSPTTADSITSGVRYVLQKRFGDAGHGFLLIAAPWAWYGHSGAQLSASDWTIEPASQARAADRIHGLGGVSFSGWAGATSHVSLSSAHTGGVLYYLAQPGGGTFIISAAEIELATIHTDGDVKLPAVAAFRFPQGAKSLDVRVTEGNVRLFGYRFDKDQPGVQYSSLGINGAQVQMILRSFEPNQWRTELRYEDPALVVLNYGTNESMYAAYIENDYPNELRAVIARVRDALPQSSILIMSPMDRGERNSSGEIETPAALTKLIEIQKRVADETGCAFFNTFEAMGGAGTMGRWYEMQPPLVSGDFIHPMPHGADRLAALFTSALLQAYGDGR